MLLLLPALILHGLVLLTNAVSIKDYPWVVTVYQTKSYMPTKPVCGGSVISRQSVLTSSRCLLWAKFNEITVKAGADDIADGLGVWYDAEDIFMHPEAITLDSLHWINDIGLIFVIGYFGDIVKPIPLSVVPTDRAMQIELQGYGSIVFQRHPADPRTNLQTRTLFIRAPDDCEYQSQRIYKIRQRLQDHQKCTVDPNRNSSHCIINIGGPVTICGILVGVVSWSSTCDELFTPILFTDVSYYNSWIYDVTKSREDPSSAIPI